MLNSMKATQKKAVVVGPYRVHNFGDDLVGAILAKHLQQSGYEVCIPRLGRANSEWLGTQFTNTYDGYLSAADTIVVGGGGIMSDTSGAKPGASYLDIVAKAAMAGEIEGKKVFITSVGAGPWLRPHSRMLAFGVSLLASKIGVRDQESLDHLDSIGVRGPKLVLGADCALLSKEYLAFEPQVSNKIGIQFNTSQFPEVEDNPEMASIRATLERYIANHDSGLVLLSNTRGKSPLATVAPKCETLEYEHLNSYLPTLSGLRSVLTSHLHIAITAYSQRIPTFSLYVREKTKRFYEQIGRPERAIELRGASQKDMENFLSSIESATWTEQDENTLNRLKGQAKSLLQFID